MSTGILIMSLIGASLILVRVRTLLRFDRKLGYAIYKFSESEAAGLRRAKWFYCVLGFLILAYSFWLVLPV
jgi:hypothetical protein